VLRPQALKAPSGRKKLRAAHFAASATLVAIHLGSAISIVCGPDKFIQTMPGFFYISPAVAVRLAFVCARIMKNVKFSYLIYLKSGAASAAAVSADLCCFFVCAKVGMAECDFSNKAVHSAH